MNRSALFAPATAVAPRVPDLITATRAEFEEYFRARLRERPRDRLADVEVGIVLGMGIAKAIDCALA